METSCSQTAQLIRPSLNGDKLPEYEPKSTLFPKFAKDSDEPEGEIDIPHEVPELALSDDEDSSSSSSESDDDSDDDDEQFWGMSSRMLSGAPPAPQHPSPPSTPQQGRPIATTAPPALVAVPPPARSEAIPVAPTPAEEDWDPEPEEQEPATDLIDLEGDNDPTDLGLLDPNAPDEMLDGP